ncbi:hypothetical protein PFISCL1PPCAC_20953, partial [Pristionchus fissidentatus]
SRGTVAPLLSHYQSRRPLAMNGKTRGRRKTNWRTVNLADYDPVCSGEYDLEEYAPRIRPMKGVKPLLLDESVTTRSEWKYMGKQVRKMLIPGSISAFASCMWVSLEILHDSPIAAFSKIVELALPYWDALLAEEQDAWAERAHSEQRRAHWIYVRNGRSGGGGVATASTVATSDRPLTRSRKKTQEWDDDYDDEELSDTDELPSRPTRKLNVDGDDVDVEVPKDFKGEPEDSEPLPERPPSSSVGAKTVTFKMDHDEPEPREPWRERDGTRTVPPPPATYRPIIVSAVPPPLQNNNSPPPPSYYPAQSALRFRGGYMARRPSRGGFDMYPVGAPPPSAPYA